MVIIKNELQKEEAKIKIELRLICINSICPICGCYFFVTRGDYRCHHTLLEIRARRYEQKEAFKQQLRLKREKDEFLEKAKGN